MAYNFNDGTIDGRIEGMKRRDYFRKTLRIMGGVGIFGAAGGVKLLPKTSASLEEVEMDQKQKFLHGWLSSLMSGMDKNLETEKKIALLEGCGRACASRHALQAALRCKGDLEGWLDQLRKWVGAANVTRDGNKVGVVYDKCFCVLVQNLPPLNTATFCNCSRGWLSEVFSAVLEKPVAVELKDSIMMGGKRCHFIITV